jgi:hypothetical protein
MRSSNKSKPGCREIISPEPGLDPQKFFLLEAGLQRNYFARVAGTGSAEIPSSRSWAAEIFFQSQDWIGRNFFFSKPGCRD